MDQTINYDKVINKLLDGDSFKQLGRAVLMGVADGRDRRVWEEVKCLMSAQRIAQEYGGDSSQTVGDSDEISNADGSPTP